jgi:crotonobetainyl-CoA:carnitine CoA-transferase CaiB-like acyl-CoA transferase
VHEGEVLGAARGADGARPPARRSALRSFADRLANRDALRPVLSAEFARRTTAEWIERLRGHVPIAPVYSVEEALEDEQVLAREMVVEIAHPVFGRIRETGCPIKIDGVRPRYAPAAPLGADTGRVAGGGSGRRGGARTPPRRRRI